MLSARITQCKNRSHQYGNRETNPLQHLSRLSLPPRQLERHSRNLESGILPRASSSVLLPQHLVARHCNKDSSTREMYIILPIRMRMFERLGSGMSVTVYDLDELSEALGCVVRLSKSRLVRRWYLLTGAVHIIMPSEGVLPGGPVASGRWKERHIRSDYLDMTPASNLSADVVARILSFWRLIRYARQLSTTTLHLPKFHPS